MEINTWVTDFAASFSVIESPYLAVAEANKALMDDLGSVWWVSRLNVPQKMRGKGLFEFFAAIGAIISYMIKSFIRNRKNRRYWRRESRLADTQLGPKIARLLENLPDDELRRSYTLSFSVWPQTAYCYVRFDLDLFEFLTLSEFKHLIVEPLQELLSGERWYRLRVLSKGKQLWPYTVSSAGGLDEWQRWYTEYENA